eukprot:GHVS01036403.1.p1 GENE.GHVS01036403.1~~GHVS01036403.1.p1  ORF type:complete len:309 (+),score=71.00 GHVS01036403.1:407-1333(+)
MEIVNTGLPPLPPSSFIPFSSSSSCSSPATSLPSSDYPTDGEVDSDASPSSLSSLHPSHTNHIINAATPADKSRQQNKQTEFPTIPTSPPSSLPPCSKHGISVCLISAFTRLSPLLLFVLSIASVVIISELLLLSSPSSTRYNHNKNTKTIRSSNLRHQPLLPDHLQQTNQIPSSLIIRASLHLSRRSSLQYDLLPSLSSSAQSFSANASLAIFSSTTSRRGRGDVNYYYSGEEQMLLLHYLLPTRVLQQLWQSIVQTSLLLTTTTFYSLLSVLCCGGCGVGFFCLWLSGGSGMLFMLWLKAVIVLLI